MRSEIQPGALFPDYELPDQNGQKRPLSELQERNPMILTLSRGRYCAKENRFLKRIAEFYPELEVGYTRVVTITTDELPEIQRFRNDVGAKWDFLSDPERKVQKDLDIAEYTDPGHNPMIPHTVILEPGLRIAKIYNGYWYWGRPSTADLWQDLRDITFKIRPDWDLAAPGLRSAWDRGETESFYPYGPYEKSA